MTKGLAISQFSSDLSYRKEPTSSATERDTQNKMGHNDNVASVFTGMMSQLSTRMSLFSFRGFIEPLNLSKQSTTQILYCLAPTDFHSNWVKDHYLNEMTAVATRIADRQITIEIITSDRKTPHTSINPQTAATTKEKAINDMPMGDYPYSQVTAAGEPKVYSFQDQFQQKQQQQSAKREAARGTPTDQKFTFNSFIDLPKQRMALLACKSVAENPGKQFNPLILAGSTGLGKSHLLQAISQQAREINPQLKIVYITAEQWVNEYIHDIRNQQFDQFRTRYRNNIDLLLVDDLQFFAGKDASQEEFLHTIESLERRGKQVVLSANQYPYEISGLKQKLQNRLASGLIVDLVDFDEQDRQTFVEEKARMAEINLPEGISTFLASNLKESVRQLEGALLRLSAYQSMSPEKLNFDSAKNLFKPLIKEGPELSMEHILQVVIGYYDIRKVELMSKSRQKRIVLARQLSMFFVRRHMDHSLPEIGRFFGRKHSTVLASVRKINKLVEKDAGMQAVISRLEKAIL